MESMELYNYPHTLLPTLRSSSVSLGTSNISAEATAVVQIPVDMGNRLLVRVKIC